MNFPDHLFSSLWTWSSLALYLGVLVTAVRTAPWKRLADNEQLHLWLGTVVTLALIWRMRAGVQPGLTLHLLGAAAFTLMFGRSLAVIGLSLVLGAICLNAGSGWEHFGLTALVSVAFPVVVAEAWRKAVARYCPPNFFVFIFLSAFFGAALAVLATGLLSTLLFWVAGIYPLPMLLDDYLPYYVLLAFAEAWLNGAVITLMVVYVPHWVGSFDDRYYLRGR